MNVQPRRAWRRPRVPRAVPDAPGGQPDLRGIARNPRRAAQTLWVFENIAQLFPLRTNETEHAPFSYRAEASAAPFLRRPLPISERLSEGRIGRPNRCFSVNSSVTNDDGTRYVFDTLGLLINSSVYPPYEHRSTLVACAPAVWIKEGCGVRVLKARCWLWRSQNSGDSVFWSDCAGNFSLRVSCDLISVVLSNR